MAYTYSHLLKRANPIANYLMGNQSQANLMEQLQQLLGTQYAQNRNDIMAANARGYGSESALQSRLAGNAYNEGLNLNQGYQNLLNYISQMRMASLAPAQNIENVKAKEKIAKEQMWGQIASGVGQGAGSLALALS